MKKLLVYFIHFIFLPIAIGISFFVSAQNAWQKDTWQQMANMGGGARDDAGGFSIGKFGYILDGTNDTGTYFADLWRFNSDSNTWLKVDTFPGGQRLGTRAVSIGGYGYVIGGEIPSKCFLNSSRFHSGTCGGTFYADMWRYCPDSNSWVFLAACPGNARDLGVAVADSADNAIFYGTGNNNDSAYMTDWWEYDIQHNVWNQMADFPGGQRCSGIGFYLNGYVYVGTGNNRDSVNNASTDMWKYDFASNTWTRVANVPGIPVRSSAVFTIGNYAYMTLGIYGDTTYTAQGWRYDPVNDQWLAMVNFSGAIMADAVGFTIGGYGYVCTGADNEIAYSQFWKYTMDPYLGIEQMSDVSGHWSIYPNPNNGIFTIADVGAKKFSPATIEIYNVLGEKLYSQSNIQHPTFNINLSSQPDGVYFYQILVADKAISSGKLVITTH